MSLPFQPDPVILFFLFAKKFLYLEILTVLAAIRLILGRGLSRWPALAAFALALGGVFTVFAPAVGLNDGPLYASAARTMAGQGGITALLVPSAVFLLSALSPGARARWIDVVHGLMLLGLLGLWWWVS
ncbi:hypothetical protein [Antarctobacter heliothermus]|uniref:Uncharacterized protein n=1 Tax=Antarctobacter heliothermus TaxID=74033 RepID=A0A239ATG2_9RHOB|nr:hypothetical protein [Antarctobacter heliothermus]SNR98840.1 hypothetical protein SAMN04488078_1001116 [Antarctobacter heliothermus]